MDKLLSHSVDVNFLPSADAEKPQKSVLPLPVPRVPTRTGQSWSRTVRETKRDTVLSISKEDMPDKPASWLSDEIGRISAATNTQITVNRQHQFVDFVIRGGDPESAQRKISVALKQSVRRLTQTQISLSIPESLIGYVLGAKGAVVQGIQAKTDTKIDFVRTDGDSVDIRIIGDSNGVLLAKTEILRIIGHRMPKISRTVDVPSHFLPFLRKSTRFSERLSQMTQVDIAVADWGSSGVVVVGDKDSVTQSCLLIENLVKELADTLQEFRVTIPSSKHRFLQSIDGNGDCSGFDSLFDKTQCVLQLPSSGSQVIGHAPAETAGDALKEINRMANSIVLLSFDLRPFVASREFEEKLAAELALYLLASDFSNDACKVSQSSCPFYLEISGFDRETVQSCSSNLLQYLHSRGRFHCALANVPTECFGFVESCVDDLRQQFIHYLDVCYLHPHEINDSVAVLLFEGCLIDQLVCDSPLYLSLGIQDENVFNSAQIILNGACELLESQIAPFCSKKFKISHMDYLEKQEYECTVIFSSNPYASGLHMSLEENEVCVRGDPERVDLTKQAIESIIAELKEAETAPILIHEQIIPTKFAYPILGRTRGQSTKFDSTIGLRKIELVPNGDMIVKITGTQKAIDAISSYIYEQVALLADMRTESLVVPPEFYKKIIGERGKNVKRLEADFGVRISFPKTKDTEVIVKGPSKAVELAVEELNLIVREERVNSFRDSISVPSKVVSALIGKAGCKFIHLKTLFNVRIDVPKDGSDITIIGSQENVGIVKKVLLAASDHLLATGILWESEMIAVPRELQPKIIQDMRQTGIPSKNQPPDEIKRILETVYGYDVQRGYGKVELRRVGEKLELRAINPELLNSTKQVIMDKVTCIADQVQIAVGLPLSFRSFLIARSGELLREVQDRFKVGVYVRPLTGKEHIFESSRDFLDPLYATFIGPSAVVPPAIEYILARVPMVETVLVPALLKRRVMGPKASNLRALRRIQVQVTLPSPYSEHMLLESWTLLGTPENVQRGVQEICRLVEEARVAAIEGCMSRVLSIAVSDFYAIKGDHAKHVIDACSNGHIDVDGDEVLAYAATPDALEHVCQIVLNK